MIMTTLTPKTDYIIKHRGAPVVGEALILYESDSCVVIELDLSSKYCTIAASSGHSLMLGATDYSLGLNQDVDRDELTWVEFLLPEGTWRYTCGSVSRYTAHICFLRDVDGEL